MRKRSGGLHCETQQEFIELAELSQQKCGLYYDDQLNKKKSDMAKKKRKMSQKTMPNVQPLTKPNIFFDFDYNEQEIQKKQELKQLNRQSHLYFQRTITIICSQPEILSRQLDKMLYERLNSQTMQIQTFEIQQNIEEKYLSPDEQKYGYGQNFRQRIIDLCIYKHYDIKSKDLTIFKFWFIKLNQVGPDICSTYLNISNCIYRVKNQDGCMVDLQQYADKDGKKHAIGEMSSLLQILTQVMPHE